MDYSFFRQYINYILEEQSDIAYYEDQIVECPVRADEYYWYIEQSRKEIADCYDILISRGFTREEIDRELAYA